MTVGNFREESQGTPTGMVTMWSGKLSNIPQGFVVCDGNNGTPDLRNKFVKATSSGEATGTTGGQSSWTLSTTTMPSHRHSGSTDSVGNHGHTARMGVAEEWASSGSGESGQDKSGYSYPTTWDGGHKHSISSGSTGTSSPSSVNNEPAFYKIAFIMKS